MNIRILAGALALLAITANLLSGPRDEEWKQVDAAARQGLPKTAIEGLEPIIAGALADRAYPEAIRAIGRRIALEGTVEGNKPEEKIVRLQAEIGKAPAAMKPVMEALLAHWYWDYFLQTRGRIDQRTQTAEAPGLDIQSWDLSRILAETGKHFDAALADSASLQSTPIAAFDALIDKGNVPDSYRPTLFDFLAYEALSFYQAGELAAVEFEDAFEIEASGPIFADVAAFMAWKPVIGDTGSPKWNAIRLYQALLDFHATDADRSAFYDADLARLAYGRNVAFGEETTARYEAALRRFVEGTAQHEVSSRALAVLARQINEDGEPVKARELAQRGLDAFPDSEGGSLCFNLLRRSWPKSASLNTEFVWNGSWPTLDVTYCNVAKVYFRAVAVDFNDNAAQGYWNLQYFDGPEVEALVAAPPTLAWSVDLPPASDGKPRTERLAAPGALKPGFYAILSSYDPTFGESDNEVSVAAVWVSDLAMVMRVRRDGLSEGGFVLAADSGEPVANAAVHFLGRADGGEFKAPAATRTDENGRFLFPEGQRSTVVLAEHEGQSVSSSREVCPRGGREEQHADTRTVIFTDRSIYRPGQTISYKGVTVRYDPSAGKYSAYDDGHIEVVFRDGNGKEVAHADHEVNEYGSFSGEFTAPRDRVLGRMTLVVEEHAPGSVSISVEEYKRPKFQVVLDAPTRAAKLAAPVVVTGSATAYTGAAIGGAKVQWRVERAVQCPYWCWWWPLAAAKAVAHGTALTEADGTFTVQFNAEPDRSVPEQNEPVFSFLVHADVTDTSGETRSQDRTVRAGYTALAATVTADEWQTAELPVEFSIATTSFDGDPQAAAGMLTIHALKQPVVVARGPLRQPQNFGWLTAEPKVDPANSDSWELGAVVDERPFKTGATGATKVSALLKSGIYRASLRTRDRFGKEVTARRTVQVVDTRALHCGVKLPNMLAAPKWSVQPGETFTALWGTGYAIGRAFVELECNGKALKSYWTGANRTQELIEQAVTEDMRGGFTLRVTFVRENRAYLSERLVEVPWTNKELSVKWERFRSKLEPGQKEKWTAVVTGPDAKRTAAEMVATLYDASLDQYLPHAWPQDFGVFRREGSWSSNVFENTALGLRHSWGRWEEQDRSVGWYYRRFPSELIRSAEDDVVVLSPFQVSASEDTGYGASSVLAGGALPGDVLAGTSVGLGGTGVARAAKPDLSKVAARKNLNETAFFFPHLIAGEDGTVRMTFTVPEALTEWKFLGFAHDAQLRSGLLSGTAVTAKDLMVEPNPPRFVREGDAIEFTVKVSNQTDRTQKGSVELTFADAASLKSVDAALGLRATEQAFDVPAKQSRSYSWRIAVPDGMGFLTYKAVGATAQFSDGEEGYLPVLSRRILVTESLPLPIRGKATKQFEFSKLLASGKSDTLRSQSLTVQMVSQPAWYAVMALPYLMEYPYECSEQLFNRFYANALARHIAASDPKIRRIFDLWKNTPALDSPLTKNQDLKSVMLEETPWLRQAQSESQARRNVGILFDADRLDEESARSLARLADRQQGDGLWSWFPGGRPSEYISLYIATGFGRLRHLGAQFDAAPAIKAFAGLDAWMDREYREILRLPSPESYVPSYTDALYLYGRSFFLKDLPVAVEHRAAVDFFLQQSRKHWLSVDSRQSQAQLALALQRFGDKTTALAIVKSLKERSVSNEELGMFWRDTELSWWWYRAPIETQALMIEAFAEVAEDAQAVEECKVWLLKQKQTQDWKTTKATADAIYGLLVRGTNLLSSDALVEVSLGGQTIRPEKVEAGTGFYEQKFVRDEIKPAMGAITVKKTDDGVSWGSVHWQHLEDMAKVTPHEGTPLKLKKTLWVKQTTRKGQELVPVTGPVAVGDELVVRIELRTDRDMEYVHLKDQRGSGTEPVNVLSRYKYQDGLAYYESTRDTASHFFIDYLPKGVYVFEYSTRVQLNGAYQTGIAEIQCMYAPEFNSHSESLPIEVK